MGFLHQLPLAPRGPGRSPPTPRGYAPKNWVTDIIEINITNLAGVPSIVYGLLALGLFVYQFGFGQSILSAGLTLALMTLFFNVLGHMLRKRFREAY